MFAGHHNYTLELLRVEYVSEDSAHSYSSSSGVSSPAVPFCRRPLSMELWGGGLGNYTVENVLLIHTQSPLLGKLGYSSNRNSSVVGVVCLTCSFSSSWSLLVPIKDTCPTMTLGLYLNPEI